MRISLGFVTRKRPSYMIASVMSWLNAARDKSKLQFIIALDDDDYESLNRYKELEPLVRYYGADIKLTVAPCSGYKKMYERHNEMIPLMNSDCIIMLADDFFCESLSWDDIIRNTLNETYQEFGESSPVLLWMCGHNLQKNHPECVGLNKNWLDIAGVFSPGNAPDAYARDMALSAGLPMVKPPIIFYHLQRKLERPNELTQDNTEVFRKPPPYEGNEQLWLEYFGDVAKDPEWRKTVEHDHAYYDYCAGEIGQQFLAIRKRFLDNKTNNHHYDNLPNHLERFLKEHG